MSRIGKLKILNLEILRSRFGKVWSFLLDSFTKTMIWGSKHQTLPEFVFFTATDAFSRKTEPKGIKYDSSRLHAGSHAELVLRCLTPLGRCQLPHQILHKIDDFWFEISQIGKWLDILQSSFGKVQFTFSNSFTKTLIWGLTYKPSRSYEIRFSHDPWLMGSLNCGCEENRIWR